MQGASLVLTAYQDSLTRAMDITSNNIANINTTGYKRETVAFDSYLMRPSPKSTFNFAVDQGTYRDSSPGSTITTGNQFDVSIQGEGYIPIQTQTGIQYTRAGSFQLNNNGELVTNKGDKVLGSGNQILSFPAEASEVLISPDGTVTATSGAGSTPIQVGTLSVMRFEQEQALIPVGDGLYVTEQTPTVSTESRLVQGSIEQSNVQAVKEMTRMIEVSRTYQRIARMVQAEHERQNKAIKRLGTGGA